GFLHLPEALRVGADRLDPDEVLEVAEQGRQEIMDTVLEIAHELNPTTAIMGLAETGVTCLSFQRWNRPGPSSSGTGSGGASPTSMIPTRSNAARMRRGKSAMPCWAVSSSP